MKSIITNNLNYLSTYEPTYWPTDANKIPNLLDFFITKNISPRYVQINSSAELSSDHSPVIATVSSAIIDNPPNGFIHIEVIRCIKRENAWIKCKVQKIYIYVGLESGLRRWAFDGFSLELAIVVIQRRVY